MRAGIYLRASQVSGLAALMYQDELDPQARVHAMFAVEGRAGVQTSRRPDPSECEAENGVATASDLGRIRPWSMGAATITLDEARSEFAFCCQPSAIRLHPSGIHNKLRLVMLALLTLAIGGILSILLLKFYFPSAGDTTVNQPLYASPELKFGKD